MSQSNSVLPQSLKGWHDHYLPIICGEAPEGTLSLQALSDHTIFAQVIPLVASHIASDARQAALTLIHYIIGSATGVLLAPLVLDGVSIETSANEIGIVLGQDGALNAFWVAQNLAINRPVLVGQVGTQLSSLLKPIVAAIQERKKFSRRGLDLILYDAIWRGCKRLQNAHTNQLQPDWIETLLISMGDLRSKPYRTFKVQADEGDPIDMSIPRVCCVLARFSTSHACPTCPQHSDSDRSHYTEAWLRSLDEEGFRVETGRSRVLVAKSGSNNINR